MDLERERLVVLTAKSVISSNRRPVFAGKRHFIRQTRFGVKVVLFCFFFFPFSLPSHFPNTFTIFHRKGPASILYKTHKTRQECRSPAAA